LNPFLEPSLSEVTIFFCRNLRKEFFLDSRLSRRPLRIVAMTLKVAAENKDGITVSYTTLFAHLFS